MQIEAVMTIISCLSAMLKAGLSVKYKIGLDILALFRLFDWPVSLAYFLELLDTLVRSSKCQSVIIYGQVLFLSSLCCQCQSGSYMFCIVNEPERCCVIVSL